MEPLPSSFSASSSSSSWKKNLQIVLLILLVLAGIRLFLIFRERNAPAVKPRSASSALTADDYVVPAKLRAFDLRSLREGVKGKTIWVKAGNQLFYYPYDSGTRRAMATHDNPLLPPLEELHIQNVVVAAAPGGKSEQLMLVFTMEGANGNYEVSAGSARSGESGIYFDDAFFIQDPRQLYKHWPADVWNAVGKHQVKPGMNELQTALSLGASTEQGGGGDYGNRTLAFANGGKPVRVTFRRDQAVEIEPATAP